MAGPRRFKHLMGGLPAISYPMALAHEQAHQRGFAVEEETSLVA